MNGEADASVTPESPTWENWSKNIVHVGKDYLFKPKNLKELIGCSNSSRNTKKERIRKIRT